jgi:PhnB protein
VDTVPDRYRYAVVPHLVVDGAAEAIAFYERAFEARELFRLEDPEGRIIHAELQIAGSTVMLGDPSDDFEDPLAAGGTTVGLHIYVESVESMFQRALAAGTAEVQPVQDMFYGDRTAMVRDPYGHVWVLLERIEDLSPEAIVERARIAFGGS